MGKLDKSYFSSGVQKKHAKDIRRVAAKISNLSGDQADLFITAYDLVIRSSGGSIGNQRIFLRRLYRQHQALIDGQRSPLFDQ